MPACSAHGCTNRPGKKIGISFHRFPKNPSLREAWVKACRRANWSPSKVSVLCSQHFSEDHFITTFKYVHLKENAVPSIFKSFPSYYQKMCDIEPISLGGNVKNKQPKEITHNESSTDSEEDSELSLQETFFDPSGFSIPTGNREEFLKRKLESVTELYEKSWKKMKMYQRKCKLYAKQSVALKEVIESLKQINSVPNDL